MIRPAVFAWDLVPQEHHLEDHLRTCKWLITMVIVSPLRIGLFHFQMAFPWLIQGGDPITTYVRPGSPSQKPGNGVENPGQVYEKTGRLHPLGAHVKSSVYLQTAPNCFPPETQQGKKAICSFAFRLQFRTLTNSHRFGLEKTILIRNSCAEA